MTNIFDSKENQAKFKATMESIHKEYGMSGSQLLGENKVEKLPRTSSGSYAIDDITGGGYPDGRIVEIYGPESSGKTTVALHYIAEVQKKGKLAVFIDAENALDINYAKDLGVNIKDLVVAQPDSAEDCLQIAERWIQSGLCGAVIIDSVPAMVPKAEIKGEIGDNHVGLMARLMSQSLRKLTGLCRKSGTTLLFINQIREKVGVMFGNPETTPGGRALKFYATIRLDVRAKDIKKQQGMAVARTTKVKTVKNKVAPPFRECEVDIEFGVGISRPGEILDYGEAFGVINKSGNWYSYMDEKLGNGKEQAKSALNDNPELLESLDNQIREYMTPVEHDEEQEEQEDTQE